MAYDPYAIMNPPEKNIRGDSANGATGSKTSESLRNAALNRSRRPAGNVFTAMVDRQPSPSPLRRRPAAIPGAGSIAAPVPDLGRSVTYFDPTTGGTTTKRPGGLGAPLPDIGRSVTYRDPVTGGTTTRNPNQSPFANPIREPWDAPPAPRGSTTPFYGPKPGGGRYEDPMSGGMQPAGGPPSVTYYDPATGGTTTRNPNTGLPNQYPVAPASIARYSAFANPTPDTNPYEEVRRRVQKPDTNAAPVAAPPQNDIRRMLQKPGTGMSAAVPDGGYQNMRESAPPDEFGPSPTPLPPTQPANRPPLVPSTQPVPNPRPPMVPSTQPVGGMTGAPIPGNSTTYFDPRTGGTTTRNPNTGLPNQFPVQPMQPASIPGTIGTAGGRTPTGITAPQGGAQYTPTGQLLGSNGIGRRYAGGDVPADEQGASGERAKNYKWGQDANGNRVLIETDAAGNPIQQPTPPQAAPPPAVGAPPPGAAPGVPPATPPNGTEPPPATPPPGTEAGPTVSLPAAADTLQSTIASVREQFDPMFNDQQDDLQRRLMHVGSLTGATNSGGFAGSVGEEMRKLTNEQGGVLGSEISKQMLNNSQLGMQKYITDLNAVLDREKVRTNADLERAAQELQRYGIDKGDLLDRYKAELALKGQTYSADAGVNAAALQAAASQAASMANSEASKYAANLGFQSDMFENQLRYNLGAMDDQTRRYLGDQNYNLGLYGTDVSRESNIMRYLSDMWQLSPDFLRLILQGDPSQLIPGMSPGNTVTIT